MDYHRGADVEVILPDLHVCDEFDVKAFQNSFRISNIIRWKYY